MRVYAGLFKNDMTQNVILQVMTLEGQVIHKGQQYFALHSTPY